MTSIYDTGLEPGQANHPPMTPIAFLQRAASVFSDHPAIRQGSRTLSYADFWEASQRLASALAGKGIRRGDTVSVLLSNTEPMLIAHHGVPMCGGVLHAMNTRLDAKTIAYQLDHAETKILIVDREFADLARAALDITTLKPLIVDYDDPTFPDHAPAEKGVAFGDIELSELLAQGDPGYGWVAPKSEWDAISLNYTSGTTGQPKGVVYSHRSAALMGYNNTLHAPLTQHSVYLWTLPMFHCNGWCYPWTLALTGSTHICLRWVRAEAVWDALATHKVTHLCGAPIVMSTLLSIPKRDRPALSHEVNFNVAAAPPPPAILKSMDEAGFLVTHVYGLTEVYGPSVVNVWKDQWDALDPDERARLKARQGVPYAALDGLAVMEPDTMQPVPADGRTMGEIMMRGNIVMKGYLKDNEATQNAFQGGWFRTGDLGVMHPDGYLEIKDRSKDIIISGGENISSIDIENAIHAHPDVAAVAVVAEPHDKWSETPAAYIELKPDAETSRKDILDHCRRHLAGFQWPRSIYFQTLPKTPTGKIEKFKLRAQSKMRGKKQ